MRKGDNPSIRLDIADAERVWGIGRTEKSRVEMGQFFTPPEIADVAASLFSPAEKPASLLDLGAGTCARAYLGTTENRREHPDLSRCHRL